MARTCTLPESIDGGNLRWGLRYDVGKGERNGNVGGEEFVAFEAGFLVQFFPNYFIKSINKIIKGKSFINIYARKFPPLRVPTNWLSLPDRLGSHISAFWPILFFVFLHTRAPNISLSTPIPLSFCFILRLRKQENK